MCPPFEASSPIFIDRIPIEPSFDAKTRSESVSGNGDVGERIETHR